VHPQVDEELLFQDFFKSDLHAEAKSLAFGKIVIAATDEV
jgi:hypothetical protein